MESTSSQGSSMTSVLTKCFSQEKEPLVFVTQKGICDANYNFTVNVSDGVVTHPNLVKFKGYVAKSGSVHASVTVHDKFASGTGRLFGTSGRGTWNGHAGGSRCSGYWTAQRN
jgi:hypothetical protein